MLKDIFLKESIIYKVINPLIILLSSYYAIRSSYATINGCDFLQLHFNKHNDELKMMVGLGLRYHQPMTEEHLYSNSNDHNKSCLSYDDIQSDLFYLEIEMSSIDVFYTFSHWLAISMVAVIILNTLLSYFTPMKVYNLIFFSATALILGSACLQCHIYYVLKGDDKTICTGQDHHYHDFSNEELLYQIEDHNLYQDRFPDYKYSISFAECQLGATSIYARQAFWNQFIGCAGIFFVLAVLLVGSFSCEYVTAFSPYSVQKSIRRQRSQAGYTTSQYSSSSSETNPDESITSTTTSPGDKIREANNIRPSLNPTIINTISQALLQRSTDQSSYIPSSTSPPINIMVEAASLASKAIQARAQSSSSVQGDENSIFNEEESKLVAGRVVGVCMRLHELEGQLVEQVKGVAWVKKYGEQDMFGLCNVELKDEDYQPSDILSIGDDSEENKEGNSSSGSSIQQVLERIKDDPLLRMCRAECLYALFLKKVEIPSMITAGQVPVDCMDKIGDGNDYDVYMKGNGMVDFLDQERIDVLFPSDN